MASIKELGEFKKDYEDIFLKTENNRCKIYIAHNIKTNQDCCLKVISKKQLELEDYDFLMEHIKLEEEITQLCGSQNTVNFHRKLENDNSIIFELEYCETDLREYLNDNGRLGRNKKLFKEIVIGIAKALKTLQKNGVMHRDIKPDNIFIKDTNAEEDKIIK